MEELIYKIDNLTIVKLLGGIAVILIAVVGFFSNYLLTRFTQASQYIYNKEIENIKGEITKHNSVLSSFTENYLSSSQKILDKKIHAYELLWSNILEIRDNFPSGISLLYQIILDDELEKKDAYEKLDNNPQMGTTLRSYDLNSEMKKLADRKSLVTVRPYLSDDSMKLYHTYQGLIGRITYKFISDYNLEKVYNWKKDEALKSILDIALTDKEQKYIMAMKVYALNSLIDLLEHKILLDFKKNLNIRESDMDTVEYLKDLEKVLRKSTT